MSASEVLQKVAVEVAKRRLRLHDQLADFDKLRCGGVTKEQFSRCLFVTNCPVTESEIRQIQAAFPHRVPGMINYQQFLSKLQEEQPQPELLSSLRAKPKDLGAAEESLVRLNDSLVERIVASGLDVSQAFKDFDKHHSGKITPAQFERSIPFRIDPKLLAAIKEKYSDGQGHVLYAGWCSDIMAAVQRKTKSAFGPQDSGAKPVASPRRQDFTAQELTKIISDQMSLHKLRCEDDLHDYDKTRCGLVTPAQFAAALGRMHFVRFQLTSKAIDTLCHEYASGGDDNGPAKVNYMAFLNDVNPENATADPTETFNRTIRMGALPADEERAAQEVLRKVRNFVTTCRIGMKPIFHDFDRAIKGLYQTRVCTAARFLRALAVNKIASTLTNQELQLLAKKYSVIQADGTVGDDVNYNAFIQDVEALSDSEAPVSPNRTKHALLPLGGPLSPIAGTATDVVKKVVTEAVQKKVRLHEFLKDFDPLRSGTVQKEKFASALAIGGIRLVDSEIQLLFNEYASDRVPGHINVIRFLHDTDENATDTIASLTLTNTMTKRKGASRPALSDEEQERLSRILERVAHTIKSRNILLPPFFVDFDKHRSGRITTPQFDQVLSRHKLPLSSTDVDLLNKVYSDCEDRGSIFYREFIGDVDETENVELQHTQRANIRKAFGARDAHTVPADVDAALEKVCAFVQRRNVRIEEFFPDNDPLRHRCIPQSRFRIAIGALNCPLSEAELLGIEQYFHTAVRIPDGFNYSRFIESINAKLATGQKFTPTLSLTATRGADMSKTTNFAAELIERLRRNFDSRRLSTRPTFQSFDGLRKGKVTVAQFFSSLTSLGVRLDTKEMTELTNTYKTDDGMINYNGFCADVDVKAK